MPRGYRAYSYYEAVFAEDSYSVEQMVLTSGAWAFSFVLRPPSGRAHNVLWLSSLPLAPAAAVDKGVAFREGQQYSATEYYCSEQA